MSMDVDPSDNNQVSEFQTDNNQLPEVNILLLGETGLGKSTFINAFANYVTCDSMEEAQNHKLIGLIPTKFTVTDDNFDEKIVQFGKCVNENSEVGKWSTQSAKSYVFRTSNIKIRLIDTPGIGDTRGMEQDNINFETILNCIGEFKELNAICILLKPNNSKLTVMFEYCITQLLSRLEKSANKNLIFLFTNCRSTFYRPGDVLLPMRKLLQETSNNPPYVQIPFGRQNTFCVDNESFRFLVASHNNINFTKKELMDFDTSWKTSSQECWRMLHYITGGAEQRGLERHQVQDTVSINEASRLVTQLARPLADITALIFQNITTLTKHKEELNLQSKSTQELEQTLFLSVTKMEIIELKNPRTVCTHCSETVEVNGNKVKLYKQVCHDPCTLTGIPKTELGCPELKHCVVMDSNCNCKQCSCNYSAHMHIYYETKLVAENIIDLNTKTLLTNKKERNKTLQKLKNELQQKHMEFQVEEKVLIKTIAEFSVFLETNAMTTYYDSYENYLEEMVKCEKELNEKNSEYLSTILSNYKKEKNDLKQRLAYAAKMGDNSSSSITAHEVMSLIAKLYSLKHCGGNIKDIFEKQKNARKQEHVVAQEVEAPVQTKRGGMVSRVWNFMFGK